MRSSLAWALTALAAVQIAFAAPSPQTLSGTSRCGASFGLTCRGSSFGECCSQYNYCGSTNDYCNAKKGCQAGWGKCNSASGPSTSTTPKISKDGKCGRDNGGTTCQGSKYGNCCSQYGWCGTTNGHCGAGCNVLSGTCLGPQSSPAKSPSSTTIRSFVSPQNPASSSQPSASPTASINRSSNARCGNEQGASPKGQNCRGTKWGNCCSRWGYCGSTEDYCGKGCQAGFGDCQAISASKPSSSISVLPSSHTSSSTTTLESVSSPAVTSSSLTSTTLTASSPSESGTLATTLATSLSGSSAILSPALLSSSSLASTVSELVSSSASTPVVASSSSIQMSSSTSSTTPAPTAASTPAATSFPSVVDLVSFTSSSAASSTLIVSSISAPDASPSAKPEAVSATTLSESSTAVQVSQFSSSLAPSQTPSLVAQPMVCRVMGIATNPAIRLADYNYPDMGGCEQACARNSNCRYAKYSLRGQVPNCSLWILSPRDTAGGNTLDTSGPLSMTPTEYYLTTERSCLVSASSSASTTAVASSTLGVSPRSSSSSSSSPNVVSSILVTIASTSVQVMPPSISSSTTPSPIPVCRAQGVPAFSSRNGGYYSELTGDITDVAGCERACSDDPRCTYSVWYQSYRWCDLYDRPLANEGPVSYNSIFQTSERGCTVSDSVSSSPALSSMPVATSSTPLPITPSSTSSAATPPATSNCSIQGFPANRSNGGGPRMVMTIQDVERCESRCSTVTWCRYSVYQNASRTCEQYDRPLSGDGPITSSPDYITSERGCTGGQI